MSEKPFDALSQIILAFLKWVENSMATQEAKNTVKIFVNSYLESRRER